MTLSIAAGLFLLALLMLVMLSLASRRQPESGLREGHLRPCPDSPNCVCSEDPAAFVEALSFDDNATAAWERARRAIRETGGEIITDQGDYLHAIYTTPVLRFVDDVELRLDAAGQRIHVRSASRVGRSDLGTNRRRVLRLRRHFGD